MKNKILLLTLLAGACFGSPKFYYEEQFQAPTQIGQIEIAPDFGPGGVYKLEIQTDTVTTNIYSSTMVFLFTPIEVSSFRLSLYQVRPGTDKLIKTNHWGYNASIPEPTTMVLLVMGGAISIAVTRIKRGL